MKLLSILIIYFSDCIDVAHATTFTAQQHGLSFQYSLPHGWQKFADNKNNLVLTGKKDASGFRPTVLVGNTKIKTIRFDSKELSLTEHNYFDGRQDYIDRKNGSLTHRIHYKKENLSQVGDVHSLGVEYKIGPVRYLEKSFYFKCRNTLLHAKVMGLSRLRGLPSIKDSELIVKSIKCI